MRAPYETVNLAELHHEDLMPWDRALQALGLTRSKRLRGVEGSRPVAPWQPPTRSLRGQSTSARAAWPWIRSGWWREDPRPRRAAP